MSEPDSNAQKILDFMAAQKASGQEELSRAEIQRGTGLEYNQLVASLAALEGCQPPRLLKRTKGMAGVWRLAE